MKKLLTSVAMVLLLVGCASKYDDSALQTRVADLERRVNELEINVSALQTAVGDGIFVKKVQEYRDPDTQKIVGITVTFTNDEVKWFQIEPIQDYAGPVIGVIKSGSGALVWAVDGQAIEINGEEVPVYQTPVFTIDEDGNLLVSIDGSDPVVLGQVQNEGATLQDGIFTNIEVTDDAIILTLSDDSTVSIPFAEAFQLVIDQTEIVYADKSVISIPYTVSAKTASTVVGVAGYSPLDFKVAVGEEAIEVTPLKTSAFGNLIIYADSKVGLTSMVTVAVEPEGVFIIDEPYMAGVVDYVAEGNGDVVEVNVLSNIEFDVAAEVDWITLKSVKADAHVITLDIAENPSELGSRMGNVNICRQGTEEVLQSIRIGQLPKEIKAVDLSKDGTANSYIVTSAGWYSFKPVKGNTEESVGTVAKAAILWETWNNQEAVTANSVIARVDYTDGVINLYTPDTFHPGNALIAALDASDKVLWSWHIWLPETEITEVSEENYSVKKTMSRNLGALVDASITSASTVESFGLLYEWGRKDPFPGLGVLSGKGAITVAGTEMTQQEGPMSVEESIQNPTVYVYKAGADWAADGTDTAKLWGETTKTVYDPCPVGYMLPQRNSDLKFWKSDNMVGQDFFTLSTDNCSFSVGSLVFPLAGYVDDGGEGQKKAGTRTIVWSGRWDSGTVNGYGMYGYTDDGEKFRRQGIVRARGGSVRCVAEE